MKTKASNISFLIIIVLFAFFVQESFASGTPPPPQPGQIPLDPMSWVFLGAGGAIAAKKAYDKKRNQNKEKE